MLLAENEVMRDFCLVWFSCCPLPSMRAQWISCYGNSYISVLIKLQPLSLFFHLCAVFQELCLFLKTGLYVN